MNGAKRIATSLLLVFFFAFPGAAGAEPLRGAGETPRRTGSVAAAYLVTGGAVAAYLLFLFAARRRWDRRIERLEERLRGAGKDGRGPES